MRCAIVASGTRNARAISAVVIPPTARRVRATLDGEDTAGWQQRNSTSRLSSSGSSTPSSGPGSSRAACEEPGPELGVDDPEDDSLEVLFLCCHPAVSSPSRVALTLRAVGGMTTAEIARAFLVPEATMAQRISRAKPVSYTHLTLP